MRVAFLTGGKFVVLLLLAAGCNKPTQPPAPIAVEQAPASLEETFKEGTSQAAKQDPEVKQLVSDASGAIQARNYPKALFALQSLSGRSDLTYQQRDFVTRSMLAVHKALEEQANSGDAAAQQALEFRRRTK